MKDVADRADTAARARRVALFVTCVVDQCWPGIGIAAATLLEHVGCKVEVGETSQEIEPGTLVYFPPGVPHRLRAHGGTLDYFEIQAWRSFKTTILSEEPLGLKWYYEREKPGAALVEWNQS